MSPIYYTGCFVVVVVVVVVVVFCCFCFVLFFSPSSKTINYIHAPIATDDRLANEELIVNFLFKASLCHRPSNCNLSNLCGLCKSLAPEIVGWLRFRFAESLAPPAKGSLRLPFASGRLSRLRHSHSRFTLVF